ncbi:hypothetical protein JHL18_00975, partial [Clostridium sp. YIM B02505]|nr:hypothetical protein [Clostridium yunnanense]
DQLRELTEKVNKANPDALKDKTLEKVYNLSLLLKSQIYQLDEEVEVSLKIDDSILNKMLAVQCIDEAGNLQTVQATVENGFFKFKTTKLSQYGIVSIKDSIPEVNKIALDNVIKKAEAIEKALYTDESIKVLNSALDSAKATYSDNNATQKQVDDQVEALEQAIISLEKKKDDPVIEV